MANSPTVSSVASTTPAKSLGIYAANRPRLDGTAYRMTLWEGMVTDLRPEDRTLTIGAITVAFTHGGLPLWGS